MLYLFSTCCHGRLRQQALQWCSHQASPLGTNPHDDQPHQETCKWMLIRGCSLNLPTTQEVKLITVPTCIVQLCKAVFQARSLLGPDQGKSSLLYLTIPTLQCQYKAKESAIHRREDNLQNCAIHTEDSLQNWVEREKVTCAGKDGQPWHCHPRNQWWRHCQWLAQDSWLRPGARRTGHCANHIGPCTKQSILNVHIHFMFLISKLFAIRLSKVWVNCLLAE